MKRVTISALCLVLVLLAASAAQAHFGMLIPNRSVVLEKNEAALTLDLLFIHPMEMKGMDLVKPLEFGVVADGQKTDLLAGLKEAKAVGHKAWKGADTVKKPGVYTYYMAPAPYWEPAEDKFIQHLTKVVIPAFGEEEGWETPIGLKTEIVPLTRPFGNYAGNIFTGQVLLNGKPAPGTTVEVEYYNKAGKYAPANDYCVTQVVRADAGGVFSFVAPWAGWWGFAALNDSDQKIKHEGQDKDVELGAVLWTEFLEPVKGKK
jgi:cobalt/nickel transport protein